jgi:hypothetical protein
MSDKEKVIEEFRKTETLISDLTENLNSLKAVNRTYLM